MTEPSIAMSEAEPFRVYGIGHLGATFDGRAGIDGGRDARATMIERRILRIEMTLRAAGIDVEQSDLPRVC